MLCFSLLQSIPVLDDLSGPVWLSLHYSYINKNVNFFHRITDSLGLEGPPEVSGQISCLKQDCSSTALPQPIIVPMSFLVFQPVYL